MDFKGKIICNHIAGDPSENFILENCPKCKGKGWYGGLTFTKFGKIEMITGAANLSQQLEKIIIERTRATGYGTNYNLLKGVIDINSLKAINAEILRVINYYVSNQKRNEQKGFIYNITEKLINVNIKVTQDTSDPRNVIINIIALTQSRKEMSLNIPIKGRR
jgi:hypothetical protein